VRSKVSFQFKISSSVHGVFKIERLFALAIVIVDFARSPAVFAFYSTKRGRRESFSAETSSVKRQIGRKQDM
jgi:hypothetical protein